MKPKRRGCQWRLPPARMGEHAPDCAIGASRYRQMDHSLVADGICWRRWIARPIPHGIGGCGPACPQESTRAWAERVQVIGEVLDPYSLAYTLVRL